MNQNICKTSQLIRDRNVQLTLKMINMVPIVEFMWSSFSEDALDGRGDGGGSGAGVVGVTDLLATNSIFSSLVASAIVYDSVCWYVSVGRIFFMFMFTFM